uniref:Uncharacterized protein n=1 Tax=Mastacembelus armatus TaxID=205130 RepID=A0A7N8YBN2_9TELE
MFFQKSKAEGIFPKYHSNLVVCLFMFLHIFLFCPMCVAGGKYLAHVSDFVSTKKGKCFPLTKPAGAKLKIAELDDTIYRDEEEVVNGWGKFYLPDSVKMQVVGVVEGTSCPCDELVLMTCEDKQVYAYDGEELHLVASDLVKVFEEGIEYPGEAFKDMVRSEERTDRVHIHEISQTSRALLSHLMTLLHQSDLSIYVGVKLHVSLPTSAHTILHLMCQGCVDAKRHVASL